MSDTSLPPLSDEAAPIDAEFEPAERTDAPKPSGTGGPGWAAFGLIFLLALAGFALAAATAGFVPGFKPGTGPLATVQSNLATVQTDLNADRSETATLSTDIATLQSRADSLSADRTRTNSDLRNLRTEIETLQADISLLQRARVASLAETATADADGADTPDLSALTGRVVSLEDALITQLETYNIALEGLKARLEALETQAASETLNAASASNARTEAALALSAIEAAARRGRPFLSAHQKLAAAMPSNDAVARLAPIAAKAVPTRADLREAFPGLADQALDAKAAAEGGQSSWMRSLFGDGIQVRRTGETTSGDHLARARTALDAGNLSESIEHIRAANADIQPVFTDWLNNAEDRHLLEQTLEALRLAMIAEERP
ncbi:MAG: hypothetical protein AAF437_12015 [Pseudomonadota bacterium]